MELTPEWAAVVLTAIGMGAGAGAYIERRRQEARAAVPIIRASWSDIDDGQKLRLEIVNRLAEDLTITQAKAPGGFFVRNEAYNPKTGTTREQGREHFPTTRELDFTIHAHETRAFSLYLSGTSSPRKVVLTVSSSAKTFRSKRFTVIDKARC